MFCEVFNALNDICPEKNDFLEKFVYDTEVQQFSTTRFMEKVVAWQAACST